MHFGELARPASLLLVAVLRVPDLGDRLPVGYLGDLGLEPHLEFGLCLADGHVNMLIAHALEDGLIGAAFLMPG